MQHFNSTRREPWENYGDGELDPLYRTHQTETDKSLETRKKHPCWRKLGQTYPSGLLNWGEKRVT